MSALKATLACDGPVFAAIQAIQAERDQLRAEVERLSALGSWAHTCMHHTDEERKAWAACPCCAIARAERAEADAAAYLKRAESFSKLADEAEAELAKYLSACPVSPTEEERKRCQQWWAISGKSP